MIRMGTPDRDQEVAAFAEDVRRSLALDPPRLHPKYFYDALGSALFEAICQLPWYPITRAELAMLRAHAEEILGTSGQPIHVVELGCGSGEKLLALLEPCRQQVAGVHLVDISDTALAATRRRLEVAGFTHSTAHRGAFEDALQTMARRPGGTSPLLVLFLGSNIGNLPPDEARDFLATIRAALRPGDRLLLGVDLVKPAEVLVRAYDDPLGVTSAFNLNILQRLNRDLDADFDLAGFRHRALWNERDSRVEIHLVSQRAQQVEIRRLGLRLVFDAGQFIWTESSYKYEPETVRRLLAEAGFRGEHQWIDLPARFSLTLAARD
jgi:L-histidine Nalpha-methyltransferase